MSALTLIADMGRGTKGVGRLWSCVLLDNPSRREVEVDFVCFTIDDVFVAGYGIDYAEKYRELPHIVVVE